MNPLSHPLRAPRSQDSCWPSKEQELLLHAALSEPGPALQAWREWNAALDIDRDRIDVGSYRLLPLVYRHLRDRLSGDPHHKKLEGLHKRTWYENQLKFRACADALRPLHEAGIATLLLKGYPLAIGYYQDLGARPMNDIDLLVQKADAMATAAIFSGLGWQADRAAKTSPSMLEHKHAQGFRREGTVEIDLHWHVLHFCLDDRVTSQFWDASVPLQFNGLLTRTLCSTDQLLVVCSHGLSWGPVPPMRWIADAMQIMRNTRSPIDWDRLVTLGKAASASIPLHAALSYLHREFHAVVPVSILAELEQAPTTGVERALFSTITTGGNWRNARLLWLSYLANRVSTGGSRNLAGFIEHVRVANDHESNWQAICWAGSRALVRLARQASGRAGTSEQA